MPKIKVTDGHVADTSGNVVGFILNSVPPDTPIPLFLTITLSLNGRSWGTRSVPANSNGNNVLLEFQSDNPATSGDRFQLAIDDTTLGWTLEGQSGRIYVMHDSRLS